MRARRDRLLLLSRASEMTTRHHRTRGGLPRVRRVWDVARSGVYSAQGEAALRRRRVRAVRRWTGEHFDPASPAPQTDGGREASSTGPPPEGPPGVTLRLAPGPRELGRWRATHTESAAPEPPTAATRSSWPSGETAGSKNGLLVALGPDARVEATARAGRPSEPRLLTPGLRQAVRHAILKRVRVADLCRGIICEDGGGEQASVTDDVPDHPSPVE